MNRISTSRRLTASVLLGSTLFGLGCSTPELEAVQAQVLQPGTFAVTRTCPATRAIRGENPGNISVMPNQAYEMIGFNSVERKYVLVKVPNAQPDRRWVDATCGQLQAGTATPRPQERDRPAPTNNNALLPFFDQVNNPETYRFPANQKADITPPAPALTAFDQAVLKTCGAIGTKLRASDFKQLMSNYPDVLQQLQAAVGGELVAGRRSKAQFLEDLTAAWSSREGFEHIFCGELGGPQEIGGLHYFGRYLQLQTDKLGGRLPNNRDREEVVPGVVYTLGVKVQRGNQVWTDTIKGYPLVSNAQELLLEATKAFKAQGNLPGACLLKVQDQPSGKSYTAVFVKDKSAIVTFYPDATPSGKPCRR